MASGTVGVLGASSMVGRFALAQLTTSGKATFAFSRGVNISHVDQGGVQWFGVSPSRVDSVAKHSVELWICFCPIAVLSEHFEMMERAGVRKVVALSSTSRFTKAAGASGFNSREIALSRQLADSESEFENWANSLGIEWVILRPTLIYDFNNDKNLSLIADFIRRYGFFPLLGEAKGLRQPVYAADIAGAAIAALGSPNAVNCDYNLSGADVLAYDHMVTCIFNLLGRKPRLLKIPLAVFRLLICVARVVPKYRYLSTSMAERMNVDLVFDHEKASVDFGYAPRHFPGSDINRG